jgi:hypothetical protein
MRCRAHPGGIVQRAASHAALTIRSRRAANARATFRADQSGRYAPAISGSLDRSRRDPQEAEGRVGYDDSHRKGAAR